MSTQTKAGNNSPGQAGGLPGCVQPPRFQMPILEYFPNSNCLRRFTTKVTALAETFTKVRKALEATPAATAAAGVAGGDGDIPSPQQNAHTLEGHRQTMAGVVPRLYQLLSNAIEAEDAQGQGTEGGAGRKMITDGVRVVLHEASWLWVGDAFVPADQARAPLFFVS